VEVTMHSVDSTNEDAARGAARGEPSTGTVTARRDARILVVDDQESGVVLARRLLKHAGYTKVRAVSDSRDALLLARSWAPDLVLVDLHMPRLSGTDLIRKLRGGEKPSAVAILVIAGDDDSDLLARAREAGADDCLVEPLDAGELQQKVGALLARVRPA
jgi:DNA-binding response OmpR family regulator